MNDTRLSVRIEDLIRAVIKNRGLIIATTLAGLFLGIVLSAVSYLRGEMSREYVIKSSIAVTSINEDGLFTTMTNDPNQIDIHLAEDMVDAVIYVLKSDSTLGAAIDEMEMVGVSAQDLYRNITLQQYNETQIIEMTLYWRSAGEGVQILNAINKVAPSILIRTLKIGNVAVVNEPTAKYRLGGNINAGLWLYTMALGMVAGIGFAVLRLLIIPTVTNPRDITKLFSLDVLGEIPENKQYFSKKGAILAEDDDALGAIIKDEYASSAHFLLYQMGEAKHKCIYVTSAEADEGKTNAVAHLALQLSDLGKKVLLVDCDLRNPTLGTIFLNKVEYQHSLNALYRGDTTFENAITSLNGNLDILPAILERRELPLRDAMADMINDLTEKYDLILMDSAPIGRVSDSMNLNRITKDVIFVIRYDYASLSSIRDALGRLEKTGVHVYGCIVNRVKNMNQANRRYYKGYHSYRYASKAKGKMSADKANIQNDEKKV
ncbi:MAG: AAA family ATPase [Blautia sp.]|nr:AAA family ATPase [Blautia sp.]